MTASVRWLPRVEATTSDFPLPDGIGGLFNGSRMISSPRSMVTFTFLSLVGVSLPAGTMTGADPPAFGRPHFLLAVPHGLRGPPAWGRAGRGAAAPSGPGPRRSGGSRSAAPP